MYVYCTMELTLKMENIIDYYWIKKKILEIEMCGANSIDILHHIF